MTTDVAVPEKVNLVGRSVNLSLLGNGLFVTTVTVAALHSFDGAAAVVGFIRLVSGALTLLLLAPLIWWTNEATSKVTAVPRHLDYGRIFANAGRSRVKKTRPT